MRILLVDTTIGGDLIGGAQTFLIKCMAGLVGARHDVHLIADGPGGSRVRESLTRSGCTLHTGLWNAGELVDDATPVVARWINELRPDVYIVSVSPDIGWTVLPLLDPSIATLSIGHNDENTFYTPVKHYSQFLTRAVGVSHEICRRFAAECGMTQSSVTWIPYGVETLAEEPRVLSEEPLKLIYVGRFDNTQKRVSDIVAVIKQLGKSGIDFTFELIGDGDEMPNVRSELADEIEAGRVRLHGWLESQEVIDRLRGGEIFLLASAYEGFCISLIEAMANGCCPIVTDIESGNKQLVEDGVNGFVVPVGDVEGFVGRIKFLAGDRERLQEMREKAWYTGRQYSVERMVENYVSCFERAIEDARSNPRTPDPNFPLMESCRSKYPLWLRRLKARAKNLVAN